MVVCNMLLLLERRWVQGRSLIIYFEVRIRCGCQTLVAFHVDMKMLCPLCVRYAPHLLCTWHYPISGRDHQPRVILGKTIPDSCAGQHKNQYAALNKVLMFMCLMVNGMNSTESNGSAGLPQPQQGGRPSNSGDITWNRSQQRGPGEYFLLCAESRTTVCFKKIINQVWVLKSMKIREFWTPKYIKWLVRARQIVLWRFRNNWTNR